MNLKQLVTSATKTQERKDVLIFTFSSMLSVSPAQAQGMVSPTVGSCIGMGMNKVLNGWVNNR